MPVLDDILARLNVWHHSALSYQVLGAVLLAAGIFSGAAVTAFTQQMGKNWTQACGLIAAVSAALIATFNPMDLGGRFRGAWSLGDSAVMRHKADPNKYPIAGVVEAMTEGQIMIDNAKFGQPPPTAIKIAPPIEVDTK